MEAIKNVIHIKDYNKISLTFLRNSYTYNKNMNQNIFITYNITYITHNEHRITLNMVLTNIHRNYLNNK